jgi:hypothetical protein
VEPDYRPKFGLDGVVTVLVAARSVPDAMKPETHSVTTHWIGVSSRSS